MLNAQNISKYFANKNHLVLNNVSFSLNKGEIIFITGNSGAGKSTLLRTITAHEHFQRGKLFFNGYDINRLKASEIPFYRRQLGIIFQDPMLLLDRSVFNNVALPLIINNTPTREIKRKVRAALDKVSMLQHDKKFPHSLSAGEKQRVSIARAIVTKPQLVIADEPTGNLDPSLSFDIFKLFMQLNQVGVSCIITTHDLHIIKNLHQRTLTLCNGKLIEPEKTYETLTEY